MSAALFLFWFLAALVVVGAVGVVVMRQPVHSALFLLLSFVAVAGLFVLAHGEFLAAVQILVYAGGIMVLFLFTIMLVNVRRQEKERYIHRQAGVAILIGLALYALLAGLLLGEVRTMAAHDLDALVVSGSEYSGFEGAVPITCCSRVPCEQSVTGSGNTNPCVYRPLSLSA